MKIFISWSGDRSRFVARALDALLPDVIQDVQTWMSEHDINAGARWGAALNSELEACHFGLLCITPENLNSDWLLFEAGSGAVGSGGQWWAVWAVWTVGSGSGGSGAQGRATLTW